MACIVNHSPFLLTVKFSAVDFLVLKDISKNSVKRFQQIRQLQNFASFYKIFSNMLETLLSLIVHTREN